MEQENQDELITPAEEQAETIAKKVYDDMEAAYKVKIDELEKQNKTLNKQVNDYSTILRNINVQQVNNAPKQSCDDMVKSLIGGVR